MAQQQKAARTFEDRPAVRGSMPLLFGLVGPSGSGKTYSGLRLATGMQLVVGGDIFVIDTESNRALHYADRFKFRHVPFKSPFSPLDYLDAIEHCVNKGGRIVMIDSMSHEHEGPGGVLEWHAAEMQRLSGGDDAKAERMKFLAWQKPKAARQRLINTILQLNVNLIPCFRAKEKIKIVRGKEPEQLGFMPIAGDEFVYELTGKALLLPGANGVPTWQPENAGERMMVKLPEQFRSIFDGSRPMQLDEAVGAQLAQWAAGDPAAAAITVDDYAACTTQDGFDYLESLRAKAWQTLSVDLKKALKTARDAAADRLAASLKE